MTQRALKTQSKELHKQYMTIYLLAPQVGDRTPSPVWTPQPHESVLSLCLLTEERSYKATAKEHNSVGGSKHRAKYS